MRELRTLFLRGSLRCARQTPQADDFSQLLAAEIVVGAAMDWRLLISRRVWLDEVQHNVNFNELRQFFKSEWCAFLMQGFDVEPEAILELLEKELIDAMQNQNKRRRRKTMMKRG